MRGDCLHRRMRDQSSVKALGLQAVERLLLTKKRCQLAVKQHSAIGAMDAKERRTLPVRLDHHEWGPARRPAFLFDERGKLRDRGRVKKCGERKVPAQLSFNL